MIKMNITKLTSIAFAALIIAACHSTKKMATSTAAAPPAGASTPSPTPAPTTYYAPARPNVAASAHARGDQELTAIQLKYKEVTLDNLKEGYVLYTQSACVRCHEAMDIYSRNEVQWKEIIDDMAVRAMIAAQQKDQVYKYVLAIKATQPK